MLLEIYRTGELAPPRFDIFVHTDGMLSYDRQIKKADRKTLRIVVEMSGERANTHQANAIFHIISKHQHCAVAFHGFQH